MTWPLHTERCQLRPMTLADREEVFAYRGDRETNRYQGWIPDTLEDVDTWIGKRPPEINTPGTWFQLVIELNGEIIGDIGMNFPEGAETNITLGCTLAKAHQGKGLAKECLLHVMAFAQQELQKSRATAWILPANHPSIRLFEGLGFELEEEGELLKYFRKLPV
ncbi:GNAT family N-acetyltransferase [Cryomorphaceae bacterium]|nr:GNAT family N-acetyltransferase [Cryomorphaceae bacterium]